MSASQKKKKNIVQIWSDGSTARNPGPGGFAAVIVYHLEDASHPEGEQAVERVVSGWVAQTTNNRMELAAARFALGGLRHPSTVLVYADAAYLVDCMRKGWIEAWENNGWHNANKDPVSNPEYWRALDKETRRHSVRWFKVKGHAGDANNVRAHNLAQEARDHGMDLVESGAEEGRSGWGFLRFYEEISKEVGTEAWALERQFDRRRRGQQPPSGPPDTTARPRVLPVRADPRQEGGNEARARPGAESSTTAAPLARNVAAHYDSRSGEAPLAPGPVQS